MPSLDQELQEIGGRARQAYVRLGTQPTSKKNSILDAIARTLEHQADVIVRANCTDVQIARDKGQNAAFLDRLSLDHTRVRSMADSVRAVAALADPVGEVVSRVQRPSGIEVERVRVPLGVVAMIYESRPNVTIEASALTIKTGNAIILRGGSEALLTNRELARVVRESLDAEGMPADAVTLIPSTDRDAIRALVSLTDVVDLAIPRGGEALIRFVTEHAKVPVVQHYKGVCHMYLDRGANASMATELVLNAKMSRPAVCNALECLLIDQADAGRLLPLVADALKLAGCTLIGCTRARGLVGDLEPATEDDWGREFLAPKLAIRIVDGLDGALSHVARYGSGHTEAIVTECAEHAERWRREVDAACVVVNASTRFHDGGALGLGAEIGIATSRLHWRGPMGLESLTTMKWIVNGAGQIRT